MTSEPMSLDGGSALPAAASPTKDVDGVPYCPVHHARMESVSGGKKGEKTTYYKCQVEDCEAKQKVVRTSTPYVVPVKPLPCPRCSRGNKPIFCERDDKVSTGASTVLKCPSCLWKSTAFAVPQFASAHFASRSRPAVESAGIGDR